jgi:tRNA nucleotidyltransferase (CCA-adding enzyme)
LPPVGLYLALLAYRLTNEEAEQLISRLRLSKSLAQTLRDTSSIKAKLQSLADPKLPPSGIYRLLYGYPPQAITANSLASDSSVARRHIQLFLNKLRYIKTALTGDDLKRMGITPGPHIKEILQLLHEARLDGKVTSKKGEEEMVRGWWIR